MPKLSKTKTNCDLRGFFKYGKFKKYYFVEAKYKF